ncbi:MAG: potassium/proton antiporter [Bacteroidales bacterium]|nr:potassium/proton antiporter [Bacteroidales bacterium]MBQ9310029.1 potassium/proton antiporter [Bacteroidales bacterium]
MTTLFLILIAVVILTCIWLNDISARIGVPTLLAFIVLGIIFGNVGAIPVYLDDHSFAKDLCTVALIFIMFYGGFGTRWEAVKPVVRESVLLASAGVIVTAGLTGLFCRFALQWGWAESFLLGAVVSSTDAASVFSILRSKRLGLRNNTAPMLEMESGSNDPCAYMLTAIMISVMNGTASGASLVWMVFAQLVFGAGLGFCIAKAASWALQRMKFSTEGFDTLFIFAVAIAAYALPDLLGGNGYLSAYIVGIMLGNEEFRGKKSMVGFFDGLTGLMQVLIFFVLGLLARPAELHRAILPALAISVFLLLVARPAAVMSILTPFRKYSFRQQELISFVGLRGAASIVFAIMAITGVDTLDTQLFNIVFCIVLISISLQGSLIPLAARKLDMLDAGADVMKTFSDYSENTEMQFSQISIVAGSAWEGKQVAGLGLPGNVLIALVIRGKERIVARGDTLLLSGDKVIVVTKTFEDKQTYLVEKTVKPGGKRAGHAIREFSHDGLVLLVKRGEREIIPSGDTVMEAGDVLYLIK